MLDPLVTLLWNGDAYQARQLAQQLQPEVALALQREQHEVLDQSAGGASARSHGTERPGVVETSRPFGV